MCHGHAQTGNAETPFVGHDMCVGDLVVNKISDLIGVVDTQT